MTTLEIHSCQNCWSCKSIHPHQTETPENNSWRHEILKEPIVKQGRGVWVKSQPELCQQAAGADFQFSVSRNRTDGDLCHGGGNGMCQCVAFRMTNH